MAAVTILIVDAIKIGGGACGSHRARVRHVILKIHD